MGEAHRKRKSKVERAEELIIGPARETGLIDYLAERVDLVSEATRLKLRNIHKDIFTEMMAGFVASKGEPND